MNTTVKETVARIRKILDTYEQDGVVCYWNEDKQAWRYLTDKEEVDTLFVEFLEHYSLP